MRPEVELVRGPEKQVYYIGLVYYRLRGQGEPDPSWLRPGHRSWVHFRRAREKMKKLKTLAGSAFKIYMEAQFHYAPNGDPRRVFPNMLYSDRAERNWRWYREKVERRVGKVHPKAAEYSKALSQDRIYAIFTQGAWDLEGFLTTGFTEDEVFRAFHGLFDPQFILASPGAVMRLKTDPGRFGPRVRAAFNNMQQANKPIEKLRTLYEQCRTEQRKLWGERVSL